MEKIDCKMIDYKVFPDHQIKACRTVNVAKGDHKSDIIRIAMPRYLNGVDVMEVGSCSVHWLAADGSDGIYKTERKVVDDYIVCVWEVWNDVTVEAGDVEFSVHLQTANENSEITYAWATEDAVLTVVKTRNSSASAYEPMVDVYENLMKASLYTPRINEDGIWEVYDYDAEKYVATGVAATGKDGEPGKDGEDYVLTDEDKDEIAGTVSDYVDDHMPRINDEYIWEVYDFEKGEYVPTGVIALGQDYILTDDDKADIAALVKAYFVDVSEEGY